MWKGEAELLFLGNFKQSIVCDEFDKIHSKSSKHKHVFEDL
jgi:hypothetical protein